MTCFAPYAPASRPVLSGLQESAKLEVEKWQESRLLYGFWVPIRHRGGTAPHKAAGRECRGCDPVKSETEKPYKTCKSCHFSHPRLALLMGARLTACRVAGSEADGMSGRWAQG